jgi:hypothetical protein
VVEELESLDQEGEGKAEVPSDTLRPGEYTHLRLKCMQIDPFIGWLVGQDGVNGTVSYLGHSPHCPVKLNIRILSYNTRCTLCSQLD